MQLCALGGIGKANDLLHTEKGGGRIVFHSQRYVERKESADTLEM